MTEILNILGGGFGGDLGGPLRCRVAVLFLRGFDARTEK